MAETHTIVCSPWRERVRAVKNLRESCSSCGQDVAVSVETRASVPAEAEAMCVNCVRRESPGLKPVLLPRVRAEVTALTGRDPGAAPDATVEDVADVAEERTFRARRRRQRRRMR